MSSDAYLRSVLGKYRPSTGLLTMGMLRSIVDPVIQHWGNGYVNDISVSGSNAKGTSAGGQTDVDFFISIRSDVPETLKEIYWSLYQRATSEGWNPRAQNVSIGVQVAGYQVDLVPARVQDGYMNRHSLYRRKADSWTMTDVSNHIRLVRDSGRTEEIRLTKIWRRLHAVEFPSFALELAVLEATRGRRTGDLANNFWAVLGYLRDRFPTARLIDPSNTANVVSDDLTNQEKAEVARVAASCLTRKVWTEIVW